MKYNVRVKVIEYGAYKNIEANSPEEAAEIAERMYESGDTSWMQDDCEFYFETEKEE